MTGCPRFNRAKAVNVVVYGICYFWPGEWTLASGRLGCVLASKADIRGRAVRHRLVDRKVGPLIWFADPKKEAAREEVNDDVVWPVEGRARLKLNELLGIMRQVEPLLVRNWANAPILHGERTEQDVDRLALFVLADAIDDHSEGRDPVALDASFQNRGLFGFLDVPSERRPEWLMK